MNIMDTALVTFPTALSAIGAATDCRLTVQKSKRISPDEAYELACELIPSRMPHESYANSQFREKILSLYKALDTLATPFIIDKFICSDPITSKAMYARHADNTSEKVLQRFRAFLKEVVFSGTNVGVDILYKTALMPALSTITLDNCTKISMEKALDIEMLRPSKAVQTISLLGVTLNNSFHNIFVKLFPNIQNIFLTVDPSRSGIVGLYDPIGMKAMYEANIPYPCGHFTEKEVKAAFLKNCCMCSTAIQRSEVLRRQDVLITKVEKSWKIVLVDVLKKVITESCSKWLHRCHAMYTTEPVIGKPCASCKREFAVADIQKIFFILSDKKKEFGSFSKAFDYLYQ